MLYDGENLGKLKVRRGKGKGDLEFSAAVAEAKARRARDAYGSRRLHQRALVNLVHYSQWQRSIKTSLAVLTRSFANKIVLICSSETVQTPPSV